MDEASAIALASADVEHLRALVAQCAPDELVVDGSQFSPSWRALPGGAAIWDEPSAELHDAYVETLDAGTDELELHWEDGCLWMPGHHDDE